MLERIQRGTNLVVILPQKGAGKADLIDRLARVVEALERHRNRGPTQQAALLRLHLKQQNQPLHYNTDTRRFSAMLLIRRQQLCASIPSAVPVSAKVDGVRKCSMQRCSSLFNASGFK